MINEKKLLIIFLYIFQMLESESLDKRPRGRPKLSEVQRVIRQEQLKQQNVARLRELRNTNIEKVRLYSKKYYDSHKQQIKHKRDEMLQVYHLYKSGIIRV